MAKNEEKAVATVGNYAVMKHSIEDLQLIIKANIGGSELGIGDLDRIKVPAGGGTTWEIPSFGGDESSKTLDGVIAAWKEPRAYWKDSFSSTGGGTPPDCSSENGFTGIGAPGGICKDCPYSRFESAVGDDGKPRPGQACRQMRIMAIVQKDELIPMILSAPATSIQNMKKYFLRLASQSVLHYGVVTRFTLVKDKSQGGIEYSKIEAKVLTKLSGEEVQKMAGYAQVIGQSLERRAIYDRENYTE